MMKEILAWVFLIAYLILLFGTLSVAPDLRMSLNAKTDGTLSNLLPILGIIIFALLYGILIKRKRIGCAARTSPGNPFIAACYGLLFLFVAVVSLEQCHAIE